MTKKILFILLFVIVMITFVDRMLYYRHFNLLLITIDTLRPDFLSCYNQGTAPTPNIDRIAKEGTLFKNAYCSIPITLPSHTSIFTSHHPHEANVFNNGDVFDGRIPTLAEILMKNRYATGAFVSLGVLRDNFGLNRGFTSYDNTDFKKRWYGIAPEVNRLFLPWLEENAKRPFFAWVHYSDPHEPYIHADAPPDMEVLINNQLVSKFCMAKKERNMLKFVALPGQTEIIFRAIRAPDERSNRVFVDRISVKSKKGVQLDLGKDWKSQTRPNGVTERYFEDFAMMQVVNSNDKPLPAKLFFDGKVNQSIDIIRKNYAAEVQYVDNYIGILWDKLSKLGILGKTVIMLTADHGESLGEHQRVGHLYPLYSEVTKVPLIIRYPGLGHHAKTANLLVSHLDIMPTALDLLHVSSDPVMKGQSLRRYVSWSPIDKLFAKPFKRSVSFSTTYAPQGRRDSFALVRRNLKLIITGTQTSGEKIELYDLVHDPQERSNLADTQLSGSMREEFIALRNSLDEFRSEAAETQSKHARPKLNEEQKEMLKNLGYVNQ